MATIAENGQIHTRSYQLEMFERSMEGNVIVAMDTGSGKTHVALLRIMAELERCNPDKLIWFLTPGVALCNQQFKSISKQLPWVGMRVLVGSDNVDRWSEQRIWDAALQGIRVVFSTHAVLADALSHGFVRMAQLALLVFDEAHHCTRQHPANRIMRDFYHPLKLSKGAGSVPHILGLSASPVAKSNIKELGTIEASLDAVSVTPRINRHELLEHVNPPKAIKLNYENPPLDPRAIDVVQTPAFHALIQTYGHMVFSTDEIGKQLGMFCRKAEHIYQELGPWGAEYFILESVAMLKNGEDPNYLGQDRSLRLQFLDKLSPIVESGHLANTSLPSEIPVSRKVEALISFLCDRDPADCAGLIFVQQRAVVYVLSHLLSVHPRTKSDFRCATFVGESSWGKRKLKLSELVDIKAQKETLSEFRARTKNIVVATNAMEEGIDVSACNLVISFDPPATLKSFIQCRGRARHAESSYVIMVPRDDFRAKADRYEALEAKLIQIYQDESRLRQDLKAIEELEEDVRYRLDVPSTGAMLTADTVIGHLHHFCNLLPKETHVIPKPEFTFQEDPLGFITATVTLPNSVNATVRVTNGKAAWRTEKAAMKDAAFHAYSSLYAAGLLNENLLPLPYGWTPDLGEQAKQDRPSEVEIHPQLDPWIDLAKAWEEPDFHEVRISLLNKTTGDELQMVLITPCVIPEIPTFDLYWNAMCTFNARFTALGRTDRVERDPKQLLLLRAATEACRASARTVYQTHENLDYIALFAPDMLEEELKGWLALSGTESALKSYNRGDPNPDGIVTVPVHGYPRDFAPIRWVLRPSDSGESQPSVEIECRKIPKRQQFLFRDHNWKCVSHEDDGVIRGKTLLFPAQECTLGMLPLVYVQFGLFIPSILQHIEVHTVAESIRTTVLKDIPYEGLQNIVAAINTPSRRWTANYQRLEFIGDTVLKYTVSVQLYADHPTWPEGYLTSKCASIVSNARLLEAARVKGLEKFIMTERYKGGKFSPLRVSEALDPGRMKAARIVSTKIIADVVEALIGAAYIDSQLDGARKCIHLFLPEIRTEEPTLLRPIGILSHEQHNRFGELEELIGHQFRNQSVLLEAITHPASTADTRTDSYQRLEFLGDAVLDMLVVSLLSAHNRRLSQSEMTLYKQALVNGKLLGFLCLELGFDRVKADIVETPAGAFEERLHADPVYLWMFMRHHSNQIGEAQAACQSRWNELRDTIRSALDLGSAYPWVALERLNADKFLSDLVESIIGAIYVDSNGDLEPARRFVTRLGLLDYAARLLTGSVDVLHPKTVLHVLRPNAKIDLPVSFEEDGTVRCEARLDGEIVSVAHNCLNQDEARATASAGACQILRTVGIEGVQTTAGAKSDNHSEGAD